MVKVQCILARISRLCYDVSVRLSVAEVHCGHSACREDGRGHFALC